MSEYGETYGTVAERVARGVAWAAGHDRTLDDLRALYFNITQGNDCALGQWFGDYYTGTRIHESEAEALTDHTLTREQRDAWAIAFGFIWTDGPTGIADREELQAEWLRVMCDAQDIDVPERASDDCDCDSCVAEREPYYF